MPSGLKNTSLIQVYKYMSLCLFTFDFWSYFFKIWVLNPFGIDLHVSCQIRIHYYIYNILIYMFFNTIFCLGCFLHWFSVPSLSERRFCTCVTLFWALCYPLVCLFSAPNSQVYYHTSLNIFIIIKTPQYYSSGVSWLFALNFLFFCQLIFKALMGFFFGN